MSSDRFASLALIALALAAVPLGAAEEGRGGKTWRTIAELPAEEKAVLDLSDVTAESPRDAKFPYMPAERYPFEPPYTAEELGYRSSEFLHVSRWSHVIYDAFGVLTGGGYMNQAAAVGLVNYVPEAGFGGELYGAAPGDPTTRMSLYYVFPPEIDGAQDLYVIRRTDERRTTKMDWFAYAPSLRRVRRQPEPRRGERFPNNVQSFDDVIGRAPWEFDWRVLGADVLHETVRFPNTRETITLANVDLEFRDVATKDLRMMGDGYEHYRADGGVDCWVVEAKTRPEWIPGYPTSKIVYWLDRHHFYPLRIEQYDVEGKLQLVEVRLAKQENPAMGDRGWAALVTVYYDPGLDMLSYSLHDAHTVREWTDEDREVVFSPDFMRRGWLVQPLKSQSLVHSPREFYLRPLLDREKFPDERKIVIAPDVEARIRAQEEAGHLVFETED
jgi:hypothetical protein